MRQVLQVVADFQAESDEEVYEVMDFLDERLRHGNSAVRLSYIHRILALTVLYVTYSGLGAMTVLYVPHSGHDCLIFAVSWS